MAPTNPDYAEEVDTLDSWHQSQRGEHFVLQADQAALDEQESEEGQTKQKKKQKRRVQEVQESNQEQRWVQEEQKQKATEEEAGL